MNYSNASEWHNIRRSRGFRLCPSIKSLFKKDASLIIQIFLNPILQLIIAYLCSRLNYLTILVISWSIGSFLVFMKSNLLHEMSHNLIFGKMSSNIKTIIMTWISIPNVSSELYYYYRFHHLAHHKQFGKDDLEESIFNHYIRPVDMDTIIFFRLLRIRKKDHLLSNIPKGNFIRIVYIGLIPAINWVNYFLLIIGFNIFYLFQSIKGNHDHSITKKVLNDFSQIILVFGLNIFLYIITNSWKPSLYLSLSYLFFKGFLWHPYLAFWLSIHQTGKSGEPTQSVYSPFMRFITLDMCFHVEHHDFPQIPVKSLSGIRRLIPELYNHGSPIKKGYWSTLKEYYINDNWVYGRHNIDLP